MARNPTTSNKTSIMPDDDTQPHTDKEKDTRTSRGHKASGKDTDPDDIHAEALKQYERGFNRDRKNMDEAYFDLRFAAEDRAQWDEKAYADRTGPVSYTHLTLPTIYSV